MKENEYTKLANTMKRFMIKTKRKGDHKWHGSHDSPYPGYRNISSSAATTASRVFCDPQDCFAYLRFLKAASDQYECVLHAYVLMTNHVHLLATPKGPHSIPHTMQALGRQYVRYINHTY